MLIHVKLKSDYILITHSLLYRDRNKTIYSFNFFMVYLYFFSVVLKLILNIHLSKYVYKYIFHDCKESLVNKYYVMFQTNEFSCYVKPTLTSIKLISYCLQWLIYYASFLSYNMSIVCTEQGKVVICTKSISHKAISSSSILDDFGFLSEWVV